MVQNSKMKTIGKGLLSWAAVIVLAVSVIIFTAIRGTAFFSVNNLMNILRSMSVVTIFALAATVSMAPDGFDMSAGTLGTFSAYCSYNCVYNGNVSADNVPDSCMQDSGYAGNLCVTVRTCRSWPCFYRR